MSLPTLEKTWQYNVSQQLVSTGTVLGDAQQLLYNIKQSMVTFALSPWTVVSSCDASTVSDSDLWTDRSKVIANSVGSSRSWIVLAQAGLGTTQICIDYNSAYSSGIYNQCGVWMSPGGLFTGGTTVARATATDEFLVTTAPSVVFCAPWAVSYSLHAMEAADGSCTRLFACSTGSTRVVWMFDTLSDSPLVNKVVGAVFGTGSTTTAVTHSDFYNSARFVGKHGSVPYAAYIGSEAYNNNLVTTIGGGSISGISGAYPITALSLHSETAGARGMVGRFADLYFGSSGVQTGTTYPVDPDDKEFIQFLPFTMPWNGSVPII